MVLYNFKSVASEISSKHSIIEVQLTMRRVPSAVAPVVDQLMLVIRACRCIVRGDRAIETALREALKMALARQGFEVSDDIQIRCRCEAEREVLVTISFAATRQSAPYARAALPDFRRSELANEPGIRLIELCVDEVRFENDGTSLHLRKRFANGEKPSVSG